MGGKVARLGDPISCGDHIATGSSDVFANGMPIAGPPKGGEMQTTGHGCYPPTILVGPWSTTVFVNGKPAAIAGVTKIKPHNCGNSWHDGVIVSGSGGVSFDA